MNDELFIKSILVSVGSLLVLLFAGFAASFITEEGEKEMKVLLEVQQDEMFAGCDVDEITKAWSSSFDSTEYVSRNGNRLTVFNLPRNIIKEVSDSDGTTRWLIRASREVEEFIGSYDYDE